MEDNTKQDKPDWLGFWELIMIGYRRKLAAEEATKKDSVKIYTNPAPGRE